MVKDNRRENFQVTESAEKGDSSSVRDKSEGKRPMFGTYGSGVRSLVIDGRIHGGNERGKVAQRINGGGPGFGRSEPLRDENGYYLFTPKEIEDILYL